MIILVLLILHWYSSLFFQTFFHHRYSAHRQFTMSKGWEKACYLMAWVTQGFSALSPHVYGKFHRLHHAYADTDKDVHSPKNDKSFVVMMVKTDRVFREIRKGTYPVPEKFTHNLPMWEFMEAHAYTWKVRLAWLAFYVALYALFVPTNAQWMWVLLPLHCLMTPLQGAIINWFAHLIGYTNHKVSDTSRNLMPFDFLMMGEGYHNNHHAMPARARFSQRWFEWDPVYPIIVVLDRLGVIKLQRARA